MNKEKEIPTDKELFMSFEMGVGLVVNWKEGDKFFKQPVPKNLDKAFREYLDSKSKWDAY